MATTVLEKYGNGVNGLELIPSSGGVFEVCKNDNLVFSKKQESRFPEVEEIFELLENSV